MKHKLIPIALFVTIGFLSSCVSQKKYKAATADAEQLRSQVNDLTSKNSDLTNKVASVQQQAQDDAQKKDAAYAKLKSDCDAQTQKMEAAQAVLQDQYATMHGVEQKIATALEDFNNKGVNVYMQDGLVFVSMEDNLLYKSGSSKLDKKGQEALSSVAAVLNDYPKLKVIVVGNTDDRKFKGSNDNLSLSTERANSVVRVLVGQYKVDPSRLTSAGKGKYAPVGDNSTEEGRAKNRRTDIILNPDLARIWETVKEEQDNK